LYAVADVQNATKYLYGNQGSDTFVLDVKGDINLGFDFDVAKLANFVNAITLPEETGPNWKKLGTDVAFSAFGAAGGAIPGVGAGFQFLASVGQIGVDAYLDQQALHDQVIAQSNRAFDAVRKSDTTAWGKVFESGARDIIYIKDFQIGLDNIVLPALPAQNYFYQADLDSNGQQGGVLLSIRRNTGTEQFKNIAFIANNYNTDVGMDDQQFQGLIQDLIQGSTIGTFKKTPIIGKGSNFLSGSFANDNIQGIGVDEKVFGYYGDDVIQGGAGNDTLFGGYGGSNLNPYYAKYESDYGNDGNDILSGGSGDDFLYGESGNDILNGGAKDLLDDGNDLLDGGMGNDTLLGGSGNDTYYVDSLGDVVVENSNSGTDTVFSSITYTLGANLQNLTLTGTNAINGTGNELNNVITGNAANNLLYGMAGNDSISGGAGSDFLDGGTGNDTLVGGSGDDYYYGINSTADIITEAANGGTDTVFSFVSYTLGANLENLYLSSFSSNINGTGNSLNNTLGGNDANNNLNGMAGNDTLDGGFGNDTLLGGTGNDLLVGAAGTNQLTGGTGADIFAFDAPNKGIDKITDFSVVDDTIQISAAGFGGGLKAGAALATNQFVIGASAQHTSDRFIYNQGTGALFFDADGLGGAAQTQIATLSTGLA
ncbi:MAG: calcium-binding protein, partial [Microcystaceae cyanobacterium]